MNNTTFPSMNFSDTQWNKTNLVVVVSEADLAFRAWVNSIDYVWVPLVVIFGIFGNVLSFIVFLTSHLRHMSWSVYLAGLSLSDTGFLVCLFVSWSSNINIRIYHTNVLCQIFVYLTYVWSFLSVWYVVAFTVERYIVVLFPLKRNEMCTPSRAKKVVAGLAIFAGAAYNFGLWTSGVQPMYGHQQFCSPLPQFYGLVSVVSNVDTVITLAVPFLAIFTMNCKIIYVVFRYNANRSSMMPSRQNNEEQAGYSLTVNGDAQSITSSTRSSQRINSNRMFIHMTKMLVIISSSILLLNLPSHGLRLYVFLRTLLEPTFRTSHRLVSLQKLFHYIYYTNFAANFFLYSACGKTFRTATRHLFSGLLSRFRTGTERDREESTLHGVTRTSFLMKSRQSQHRITFDHKSSTLT